MSEIGKYTQALVATKRKFPSPSQIVPSSLIILCDENENRQLFPNLFDILVLLRSCLVKIGPCYIEEQTDYQKPVRGGYDNLSQNVTCVGIRRADKAEVASFRGPACLPPVP